MTLATSHPQGPRVKRWSKQEYNEQVEQGWFEGKRLFLFRGELIEMPAMGAPHALAVTKLTRKLIGWFPDFECRIQLPLEVPGDSMPEPDAAIVATDDAQRRPHPNRAALVIEVSDTSYPLDVEKAHEYAAANVPDFWIQDVNRRTLEVFRSPIPDASAYMGFRYAQHRVLSADESVSPLVKPALVIPVSELFP